MVKPLLCIWIEVSGSLAYLNISKRKCSPLLFVGVKKLATLNPRLDRILKSRIPVVRGADGRNYYEVDYKISASYFSAHCEYELWFKGKNHGGVKVYYA